MSEETMKHEAQPAEESSLLALGYSATEKVKEDKKEEPADTTTKSSSKTSEDKPETASEKQKKPVSDKEEPQKFNPFVEPVEKEESKQEESSEDYKGRFESTRAEYLKAARQLAHAKKCIQELAKEHDLDSKIQEKMLDSLEFKASPALTFNEDPAEQPFMMKVLNVVQKELPTFKKYNTSDSLDKFLTSFERWYVADSSAEEKELAHKALSQYIDDPAQLIQKIAHVGKTLYDKIYSSLEKSGGLFELLNQHTQALDEKNKTIELK